jgi:hypothetical protein
MRACTPERTCTTPIIQRSDLAAKLQQRDRALPISMVYAAIVTGHTRCVSSLATSARLSA